MAHLPYRCLVLDHDDTVVESSKTIHYPAHLKVMEELRPGVEPITFSEWIGKNMDPGIMKFLTDELGMNEREIEREFEIWQSVCVETDPPFFDGIIELLTDFKHAGGLIVVASHSVADLILRNYRTGTGGAVEPDAVFGWDDTPERRKPSAYPVLETMRRFDLDPADILVVDDLKPGVDMARAAGVSVAGAGWGYSIDQIRNFMEPACDFYFETVSELRSVVLDHRS